MLSREILEKKGLKLITTSPETGLKKAMEELLKNKISCLPVLGKDDQLIGIVSDKDIFAAIYKDAAVIEIGTVGEIMTENLIVGVADDNADYIAGLMTKNKIRHIPIVEKDKLIGLLSIGDIVKARLSNMEVENRYLKNYIDGTYPG